MNSNDFLVILFNDILMIFWTHDLIAIAILSYHSTYMISFNKAMNENVWNIVLVFIQVCVTSAIKRIFEIMLISLAFLGTLFLQVVTQRQDSLTVHSKRKITIAISKQHENLKSFDKTIIENFGQKFNLQVDFIIINTSVNIISK